MTDNKLREEILKLKNKGMTLGEIAKTLKTSKAKVYYHLKMAKVEDLKKKYERKLAELEKLEKEIEEKERLLEKQVHEIHQDYIAEMEKRIQKLQAQVRSLLSQKEHLEKVVKELEDEEIPLLGTIKVLESQLMEKQLKYEKMMKELVETCDELFRFDPLAKYQPEYRFIVDYHRRLNF